MLMSENLFDNIFLHYKSNRFPIQRWIWIESVLEVNCTWIGAATILT